MNNNSPLLNQDVCDLFASDENDVLERMDNRRQRLNARLNAISATSGMSVSAVAAKLQEISDISGLSIERILEVTS